MTLVELVVVMGMLGVLFTAVYMFFVKGTEQFHFTRRQNELSTTGRLALEILSDEIIWAGYMPRGGWTEDQWNPVELASVTSFHFYADYEGDSALDDSDHRKIFRDANSILHITDDDVMDRRIGTDITAIQFNYLDGAGNFLGPMPLDDVNRDAVRHIVVKLTLQSTYMGDVYQTVMQTMITPRNLGIYHNFDPLFYMPPPPDAKIVVNVDGDSLAHVPTVSQEALLTMLDKWGYTLVELTDDELVSYDYDSSGVDIVILRDIPGGTNSHIGIAGSLQAIHVPIIALDPDDAKEVFLMGDVAGFQNNTFCTMYKVPAHLNHPIHDNLDNDFDIYKTSPTRRVTILSSRADSTDLITDLDSLSLSGVSVIHESTLTIRRVHYCAPDFQDYSGPGEQFLYNVILWNLPDPSDPPLGEEINQEGFEGESPGDVLMTFWEDSLEGGEWQPDSIPLYSDFFTGGVVGMAWSNVSTGEGQIVRRTDNVLKTDRVVTGGFDRNVAATVLDLSNYSTAADDLYMRMKTWRGVNEVINAEDGVFIVNGAGSVVELASQNFENLVLAGGDVEFWGDLHGRHRIHCPDPYWGGNSTNFVTMDSRTVGEYSRVRMIFELDTSLLSDGTAISVNYRMSDHGDATHNYDPVTQAGDFIGWSLGNGIDDPIEGYIDLLPGTQSNGDWHGGNYAFTPPGAMPSTIYVIFGQYDDNSATSATAHAGMSFDDISIIASNTADMDRIGVPSSDGGFKNLHIDLDDAAASLGVPFSADFGIALSQYGIGPWTEYGLLWVDFEIGRIGAIYEAPGWDHGPVVSGEKDDWLLETILGDHKYTLHANDLNSYSNSVDCWLESPEFSIPFGADEAKLSFEQTVDMEAGYDFGWVEVSTNGGSTWQVVETPTYNGFYAGHGAYTGSIAETVADISLDSYVGQSVKFRFIFHSDENGVRGGWTLNNFVATGIVSGLVIESIGFKPTDGAWNFDQVDVYLGRVTETSFAANGEWDKGQLTYCGTYQVTPPAPGDWATIELDEDFILLMATNLLVKLEMSQAAPTPGFTWATAYRENMTRWETSPGGDPGLLKVGDNRPAFMLNTVSHGQILVDADSTGSSGDVPLSFGSNFSDFEGLYLLSEMGFSSEIAWVHGGDKDDWEIGAPIFIPEPDPALLPSNQNKIAGNDLTDDGLYMADAWCWIHSYPYDLADAAAYDSVCLAFDRNLRLALNDDAYIHMAFTDSAGPPTDESDWIKVAQYVKLDEVWVQDVIQLTPYFQDAIADGKNYYFVRFLLYSGCFAEKGGWNIDNVGFYGRNSI